MTTVEVLATRSGIYGLSVRGHAGAAPAGKDLVCAAISSLITTCANALETVAGVKPVVLQSQQKAQMHVLLPRFVPMEDRHDCQIVFRTVLQGLEDLADAQPQYLQIKDRRKFHVEAEPSVVRP